MSYAHEVGGGGVCACLSVWRGVVVHKLTMYFHNIISYIHIHIRILYLYSTPIPMFYTYVFLICVRES